MAPGAALLAVRENGTTCPLGNAGSSRSGLLSPAGAPRSSSWRDGPALRAQAGPGWRPSISRRISPGAAPRWRMTFHAAVSSRSSRARARCSTPMWSFFSRRLSRRASSRPRLAFGVKGGLGVHDVRSLPVAASGASSGGTGASGLPPPGHQGRSWPRRRGTPRQGRCPVRLALPCRRCCPAPGRPPPPRRWPRPAHRAEAPGRGARRRLVSESRRPRGGGARSRPSSGRAGERAPAPGPAPRALHG